MWFDEDLSGFALGLVLIILTIVAVLLLIPMFVFVVELVIVALVAVLAVVLRVVLRRPWIVDAFPIHHPASHLAWKVAGLRQAKDAVALVAQQISAGVEVPQIPGAELANQPPTPVPQAPDVS